MKYYKILNKEENHHGFQYKTGLNIDTIKFNPVGSCEEGGLYFSRKDIFAFLDCGSCLRKVTLPKDAKVYKDPKSPEKWKADKIILGKREKITLKVIKRLVKEGADIHANNDLALRLASYNGYLGIVKYLVSKGADIHVFDDYALIWASRNGHLSVVKYLKSIK